MAEKTKRLSRQKELCFALGFNEQDLALNRKGRMSERQKERASQRERINSKSLFAFTVFCICLAFISFSIFIVVASKFAPETVSILPIPFLMSIIGLWITWDLMRDYRAMKSDFQNGKLKSIEGLAIVDIGHRNKEASLTINGMRFHPNRNTLLRIKQLEPHIVYYVPKSKVVVAVEVLENKQ
jgi:hypothetical protein